MRQNNRTAAVTVWFSDHVVRPLTTNTVNVLRLQRKTDLHNSHSATRAARPLYALSDNTPQPSITTRYCHQAGINVRGASTSNREPEPQAGLTEPSGTKSH